MRQLIEEDILGQYLTQQGYSPTLIAKAIAEFTKDPQNNDFAIAEAVTSN